MRLAQKPPSPTTYLIIQRSIPLTNIIRLTIFDEERNSIIDSSKERRRSLWREGVIDDGERYWWIIYDVYLLTNTLLHTLCFANRHNNILIYSNNYGVEHIIIIIVVVVVVVVALLSTINAKLSRWWFNRSSTDTLHVLSNVGNLISHRTNRFEETLTEISK